MGDASAAASGTAAAITPARVNVGAASACPADDNNAGLSLPS